MAQIDPVTIGLGLVRTGDIGAAFLLLEAAQLSLSKNEELDKRLSLYLSECLKDFLEGIQKTNKHDVMVRKFASSFHLTRKKNDADTHLGDYISLASDIHAIVERQSKKNISKACKEISENNNLKEKYGLSIDAKRVRQLYDRYLPYVLGEIASRDER